MGNIAEETPIVILCGTTRSPRPLKLGVGRLRNKSQKKGVQFGCLKEFFRGTLAYADLFRFYAEAGRYVEGLSRPGLVVSAVRDYNQSPRLVSAQRLRQDFVDVIVAETIANANDHFRLKRIFS